MTTNRIEVRFFGPLFDCEFNAAGEWFSCSESVGNEMIDDVVNAYESSMILHVDDYVSRGKSGFFVTRTWYLNSVGLVRKTYRYLIGG